MKKSPPRLKPRPITGVRQKPASRQDNSRFLQKTVPPGAAPALIPMVARGSAHWKNLPDVTLIARARWATRALRSHRARWCVAAICVSAMCFVPGIPRALAEKPGLDKVTLQLQWTHQFQFAGYYAAKEKGFYRDAGLDVELLELKPGLDSVQEVAAARADFGVGETSLLLARQEGKPVVLLANIFQHSALVLAMRHAGSLDPVHTLKGKRVMLDSTDAEIVGYLTKEGLPPKSYDRIDHSLSTQDFLAGKVDAVSVYLTEKHDDLERAGVPCLLLTPRSADIDFYGDNLFTSEAQIRKHPGRVIAFRDASLKGWEYALDHPEEIIDLIVSRYPSRLDREHLVYEAQQMKELIQPDLIHVGYVNPSRWKEIARTYAGLGMLASDFDLAGFIYQPDATRIPAWLAKGLAAVAAILFLGFLLVLFVLRANRRLARSEKKLADSEARFRLAFDNANTGMCLVGLEGKILQANEKMAVIFGYSKSELEGMSVADLAVPEETDISLKFMREAIEGDKESVTYEKRYLHRMGRTIYGLIAASLIRDDHGKMRAQKQNSVSPDSADAVDFFALTSRKTRWEQCGGLTAT